MLKPVYTDQFLNTYEGHSLYIPATKGEFDPKKNKLKYNYNKKRLPVSQHAAIMHINYGTPHMVVNPINEKTGKCKFGAIDVDDYNQNFETTKHKIYSQKLPLNIVDSVSGGLHLYLYSNEPVDPRVMINALQHYRKNLDYQRIQKYSLNKKRLQKKILLEIISNYLVQGPKKKAY
jgi:hypothetical protein